MPSELLAQKSVRHWRDKYPERQKRQGRIDNFRKYGVADPTLAEQIWSDAATCNICKSPLVGNRKHLDHNHSNGKIRGVLCPRCNLLVGYVEKNRALLPAVLRWVDS